MKLLLELIENPNTSIDIYKYMIELILIDKVSRMFTSKKKYFLTYLIYLKEYKSYRRINSLDQIVNNYMIFNSKVNFLLLSTFFNHKIKYDSNAD